MTVNPLTLLQHLRRLTLAATAADTDAALLGRFVQHRDQAAFAALVARHGSMVLRVCRRVLSDAHTAEDAFQAAFLVLARRAASIRVRDVLAAWLHGVAYRVALKARTAEARRRCRETAAVDLTPSDRYPDPLAALTARELLTVVDEEVRKLPELYRAPVILCCLEGRSQEEAARLLGWTPGSLQGRLERGRTLLRARLTRRGLSLSAAFLSTALAVETVSAMPILFSSTARAATVFAGVGKRSAADVSAGAVALAELALKEMGRISLNVVLALTLTVGVAVVGAGMLIHRTPVANPAPVGSHDGLSSQPEGGEKPARQEPARAERASDPLPPGALARMGSVRFWSGSPVHAVAFAPDDRTMASGNADGTVRFWEADTGKEILVLPQQSDPVMGLAYSPDGKFLASRGGGYGFQDNSIHLWDLTTGKEVRRFGRSPSVVIPSYTGSPSWAFRVSFSPDGKLLASADGNITGKDNLLYLWDVTTGEELRRCRGHEGEVRCFAFAPDGKTLASSSADGTIRLWDPATGKELRRLLGHKGTVPALSYGPGGKVLASGGEDGVIRFWEAESGKELKQLKVAGPVQSLVIIDEQTVAWGAREGFIHLVDVKTGKEARRLAKHISWVSDLCCSRDGKVLASVGGGMDFAVHRWQVETGKMLSPPPDTHRLQVVSLSFAPDGRTLASASWDGTVRFWNPGTGEEARPAIEGRGTCAVVYSRDGKLLATVDDGGMSVRILDEVSRKELRRLDHPGSGNFQSLAFSPDGKTLATGENRLFGTDFEGVIGLWDVTTGKELRVLRGHRTRVESVAFSPDGKTLVSGGEREAALRLWDVATGKELRQLQGHQHYIQKVAFSADGAILASAGVRTIRLWEPATGKELRTIDGGLSVHSLALSPDGRMVAAGTEDNGPIIRLWEVETGQEVRRWTGHRNLVRALAFAPDGKTLASGGYDALALVWDVTGLLPKGRPAQTPLARKDLEELWQDLAGEDASRAQHAVWMLTKAPGQAGTFLGERLRPLPATDARRLARLMADLDSDEFARREEATAELEQLEEGAESALRAALKEQPSPEVRRRAEQLLQKLAATARSSARLQAVRGLQALEYLGTPEARQVLQALAKGAPDARLTREAKAALERLARQ
jgi:RNA polymerase sigma factor (sigma-70 family)